MRGTAGRKRLLHSFHIVTIGMLLAVIGLVGIIAPGRLQKRISHMAAASPATPRQWRMIELQLHSARDVAEPLRDGVLVAVCTSPAGEEMRIAGFWNGDDSWKIRFTPTSPGRWNYRTICADASNTGLHGQTGILDVLPAAGKTSWEQHGGFLRVSSDRRSLTHTDGTPFFWLGDTWWFCPSDLMPIDHSNRPGIDSMFQKLIDTRATQGYSVIQMAFLGRLTPEGVFSGVSGQFQDLYESHLNPAYWQMVDRYLSYAIDAGILPVIGFGFHQGLNASTLEQDKTLWRYVMARYSALPVTWLICGEYNQAGGKDGTLTDVDAARIAKILQLGQAIKDSDPYRRAMTVHPWWHKGEGQQAWSSPWHDFILLQGGHIPEGPAPDFYRAIGRRTYPKPFLEGECTYEGIRGFSDAVIRYNAYKAIQCGSFGYTYGAHGLWYPTQDETDQKFKEWGAIVPWWKAMEFPGGAQMRHLGDFYRSLPWWTLMPVETDSVLEWTPHTTKGDDMALVTSSGPELYVAYFPAWESPEPRPAIRFIPALSGTAFTQEWFDPRTGVRTSGKTQPDASGISLRIPTTADWLCVLRKQQG